MSHGPRDLRLFLRDALSSCGRPWNRPRSPQLLPRGQSTTGSRVRRIPVRAPLLGLSKDRPSTDTSSRVHSRAIRGSLFGTGLPPRVHVPPLSFLPTSAVYSAHALQVYCTLQPVVGFALFPISPSSDPRGSSAALRSSPSAPFTPFRAFPSPSAAPRHRGRCPLVIRLLLRSETRERVSSLPSHRPPQGVAPTSSPLPDASVSTRSQPDALLGFVPLQDSPLHVGSLDTCPPRSRRPRGVGLPIRFSLSAACSEEPATTKHRRVVNQRVNLFHPAHTRSPRGARLCCASEIIPYLELASVLQRAPVHSTRETQGLVIEQPRRGFRRSTAAPRDSPPSTLA
jgi:hypothetical protein